MANNSGKPKDNSGSGETETESKKPTDPAIEVETTGKVAETTKPTGQADAPPEASETVETATEATETPDEATETTDAEAEDSIECSEDTLVDQVGDWGIFKNPNEDSEIPFAVAHMALDILIPTKTQKGSVEVAQVLQQRAAF